MSLVIFLHHCYVALILEMLTYSVNASVNDACFPGICSFRGEILQINPQPGRVWPSLCLVDRTAVNITTPPQVQSCVIIVPSSPGLRRTRTNCTFISKSTRVGDDDVMSVCYSMENRPFRLSGGAGNMEKILRMDRDMSKVSLL